MRRSRLLLVLLLLVVVNLPPAHAAWTDHRLDGDGVTETVPASTEGAGDSTVVQVSLPPAVAEALRPGRPAERAVRVAASAARIVAGAGRAGERR